MVTWLLEPEVFQSGLTPLIDKLEEMGVEYLTCQLGTPYEDYIDGFGAAENIVFHGSFQFAKLVKEKTKWKGFFYNLPQFDCTYYYPRFGERLLNNRYIMIPFGELDRQKDWLMNRLPAWPRMFVRPSGGFKEFTGRVVHDDDWEKELRQFGLGDMEPESLVLVAMPKEIIREWRLVVVNGKIVASSQYKNGDRFERSQGAPQYVLSYGEEVLSEVDYRPDPAWMLDICESKDPRSKNGLYVLEVGPFACCGIYDSDPESVIRAVNDIVS